MNKGAKRCDCKREDLKKEKNRVVRQLIRLHTKLLEEMAHLVKSLIKLLKIEILDTQDIVR